MGGYALAFVARDLKDGAAFTDRALALNPSLAAAWLFSAWVRLYLGEHDIAIERFTHAMRLSPLDPFSYLAYTMIGACHLVSGRYDEASAWGESGLRERPNWTVACRVVAASHALAGRMEPARKAMARLRQLDPTLRISNLREVAPLQPPEDYAKYEEGLRLAGLPE